MSYSQILRIPAFRNLWLGQTISQLGDAFYYVSFMFMVQKVTGSISMVGFVGACETIPYLLFSLYGGVVADRIDRKGIMLWSDLLSGIFLCFLAILTYACGKPPVWALMLTPFLLSTVRSFFMPAKNAAIPALVPSEVLTPANALSSLTQSIVPMISLSLSVGVLSFFYERSASLFLITAVMLNSLSFFGSALFVAKLPKLVPVREAVHIAHPWIDLKDGLKYIRMRQVLVVLLVVQFGMSLAISPFFVVYVETNSKWFGGKPATLAICELAFFVGMVIASLLVGRVNVRRAGLGFILGTATVGITVLLMAFSRYFPLFVFWNLVAGLGLPFADIPVRTWMQLNIPDSYRGRINSVSTMLAAGTQPVGMGMGGVIVAHTGIQMAFVLMGGGMAVAAFGGLLNREFRRLEINPNGMITPTLDGSLEPAI